MPYRHALSMFDEPTDPWQMYSSPPESPPRSSGDLTSTILLLIALLVAGVALSFVVLLEHMSVARCAGSRGCDYALLGVTTWIVPVVVLIGVAATIAGLAARAKSGFVSWWLPLVGLVFTGLAFVIVSVLVDQATAI